MKFARRLVVPAIVLAMSSPLISHSVASFAAGKTDKAAASSSAKPTPANQALLKFSEAGSSAMRDIRGARFSIFEGRPKVAIKQMEAAQTYLKQAESEAPTFDTKTTILVGGKVVGKTEQKQEVMKVPFDAQLLLADNFVMTPEKKVHIDKANEHLKKGDQAKALDELRLGEIDINFSRAWVPITQTKAHLATALQLANDGKYYEANLALKAIEDGVTIDSVDFRDLPPPTHSAK